MWQDNISKNDMLGFDLHARIIIALLQEQKMLPLTLGVLETGEVENPAFLKKYMKN